MVRSQLPMLSVYVCDTGLGSKDYQIDCLNFEERED